MDELYRGWRSIELRNEFVRVNIVPQLGGRVLNYQLGEHAFLWTNPLLSGAEPPASGLAHDGSWLNWGGDKLWIAPQGWDNEAQWAGPPDPVLDGGPYSVNVLTRDDGEFALQLVSAADPRTGMQLSRVLRLDRKSSRLHIVATMKNTSDLHRCWGIWSVTQIDATSRDGTGWNPGLRTFVPVNRDSAYAAGYRVLYGEPNNPQFSVEDGLFQSHYQRVVGKVGLDSDAGWMATVDASSGNVFVQRAHYQPGAEYPDGASVEIWTNGLGSLTAYGKTEQMADDPEINPYVLECELLSPLARLGPGESTEFVYDWYAANIGVKAAGNYRIIDCSAVGCVVEPLTISARGELGGRFGVFHEGCAAIEFLRADMTSLYRPMTLWRVSPLRPFLLDGHIHMPESARWAILALYGPDGARLGELTRVPLSLV